MSVCVYAEITFHIRITVTFAGQYLDYSVNFIVTEPGVGSSDATNMQCSITRHGNSYLVNGRKWWSSGADDPCCKVAIVMGVTDKNSDR